MLLTCLLCISFAVAQIMGQCYDPVSGVNQDYCHGGFCQVTFISSAVQPVSLCICPPGRSGPMCGQITNSIEGPFKVSEQKWASVVANTALQAPQGSDPDFRLPLLGVFVAAGLEDCKKICTDFNTDFSAPPISCGTIVYHEEPSTAIQGVTVGICEAYTVKPIKGCESMLSNKQGYTLAYLEPFFNDKFSCH